MKPRGRHRERLNRAAALDEQLGARLKPLVRKIGFRVDDHLAADPVRARDPPDEAISSHFRSLLCGFSRISSVTFLPSLSPAVAASVRSAAAVRP